MAVFAFVYLSEELSSFDSPIKMQIQIDVKRDRSEFHALLRVKRGEPYLNFLLIGNVHHG